MLRKAALRHDAIKHKNRHGSSNSASQKLSIDVKSHALSICKVHKKRGMDRQYYAVDMYLQTPRMLFSEMYVWHVLFDCIEPSEWLYAHIAWCEGIRTFPMG